MALNDIRWQKHLRDLGWNIFTNRLSFGIWFGLATVASAFVSAATGIPAVYTWVCALIILFLLRPRARLLQLRSRLEGRQQP
ncbi:hypothetical protein ILFOPFJJ_00076 [Ensifer psoraleae]|nr:hypothetical protein [Sinorhizobium psoraleae]